MINTINSLKAEQQMHLQQHYFDAPLCNDLESKFFAFALKNNLTLEFLKVDCNDMPEFRIKGTKTALELFIDIIYDCNYQPENDYMKTFIKVIE
jgi:hypothetical protein